MHDLELRGDWYLHPLERQIREQFDDYIKSKKAEQ